MNVRGLHSNAKKRIDIFEWAKDKKSSIVCFQETHSSINEEKLWEDEWGNLCILSHFTNRRAGVSVMLNQKR